MLKSAIYLFIALLLLSLGLTLIPNVFSQTQNIKVLSYSYYVDNSGILDVVGEIQNVGSNTVDPVYLTGSVYSSSGVDLSDSYAKVWVSYLAPQQKAPFYMEFYPPSTSQNGWLPADVSKVTLTVSIANATTSYQYPDLKITSNSQTIGTSGNYSGAYLVNGIIQNTGSQTATNITVVATFYNATGTVVAVGYTNYLTPATVAPSGTISFQIGAFDLNQTGISSSEKISSYSLLVQAQGPILQGTAPIATPYQGSGSSPSSSSSPTDVNSNNASNPAVIYAIVIVVVLIAVAGTIVALRKSKPHETVKAAKKARKKRMVEILPRAFFSKLQGTTSRRNVAIV